MCRRTHILLVLLLASTVSVAGAMPPRPEAADSPYSLAFSSYLGGSIGDYVAAIALAGDGTLYLAGGTSSPDFRTCDAYQPTNAGGNDGFVVRVSASGSELLSSTYYGGTGSDGIYGIALGGDGGVWVCGATFSADLPLVNPYDDTPGGNSDAFVAKFDATLTHLLYATRLGGMWSDIAYGIATGPPGTVFVGGKTWSPDFPTVSPLHSVYANATFADGFVTRLAGDGSPPSFSTTVGGGADDGVAAVASDPTGHIYITGTTWSTQNFPLANALQDHLLVAPGAFASKIHLQGPAFVYSTFLDSNGDDRGYGIAADGGGHAYLTGVVSSSGFPLSSPLQGTLGGGGGDLYITKVSPAGESLPFSTFLGGPAFERGVSITAGPGGEVFVVGTCDGAGFPTAQPLYADPIGSTDWTLSRLSADGSQLLFSSYFGGTGSDIPTGVAADARGDFYACGSTPGWYFPTKNPFQSAFGGGQEEGAVAKVYMTPPPLPGDCSGDGTVSIGEVQKAINMFLGSIPPDCGVDCNGDGGVSIGEVQKVINAFLGVASSC